MVNRRNQIGPGGIGRQVSKHKGDRPGRQSAALGASDISTGSNMRVNKSGQLEVNKAKRVISSVNVGETELDEALLQVSTVLDRLINSLQDAGLMER